MAVDDDAPAEEIADAAAAQDSGDDIEAAEVDDLEGEESDGLAGRHPATARLAPVRAAALVGVVSVVAVAALIGWFGFRQYQADKTEARSRMFLEVGRQGAINLTTIDYQHADTDVQRILDSATGTFYDDFKQRSGPFIEVVKKAQSKSVGTITEAGLESVSDRDAQVMVAVSVKTTNAGTAEQVPRAWRMRIDVTQVGGDAKVSNVAFVP
ncbi:Mce protein [Mycobacterium sp. 050134]|uniref:Mce protein n=1 Tax=Mycobacterium sp. 050134 TaxID=3096111 RepID=UPI002ED8E52B